jgi:release factor glutamine methyltransferase
MEKNPNSVKSIIQDFKDDLSILYPDKEIMHILYLLFEEIMGWPKTRIHLSYDAEIPEREIVAFRQILAGLTAGKPIQYILGWALFDGCKLAVNSNVLIPRPETEELCQLIKSDFGAGKTRPLSILDIGTGSGCISIALKMYFLNARVVGIDSSQPSIELARQNAVANLCEVDFLCSDILIPNKGPKLGMFDVIVSNPPYVLEKEKKQMHQNVIDFEPAGALFVPDNDPLLFYRAITGFAHDHLLYQGSLYFEINENFGMETCKMVQSSGFEKVEVLCDMNGKNRFVRAGFQK